MIDQIHSRDYRTTINRRGTSRSK